jgi:hypothetical protein
VDARHSARTRSGASLRLVPSTDRQSPTGADTPGAPDSQHPSGSQHPSDALGSNNAPDSRNALATPQPQAARLRRRFPLRQVGALNGLTAAQYVVGCAAIVFAYRRLPIVGLPVGLAYLVYAVTQHYVLMPLTVCPGCVYRAVRDGRCPSGLNVVSALLCERSATAGDFQQRSRGALCSSRLAQASWLAPLPLVVPGLVLSFSAMAALLTGLVAVLALLRLLVVRRAVCPRCLAQRWCPEGRPRLS